MKLNLITQSHPALRIRSNSIPESRVSSKCICCTFRYYHFFLVLILSREGERENRARMYLAREGYITVEYLRW